MASSSQRRPPDDDIEVFIPDPSWRRKFRDAFRGVLTGFRSETSFVVHLPAAGLVLGLAWWLRVTSTEWCLFVLSIAVVIAAELFNCAVETLAQAIDRSENPLLGKALDVSSGAVLMASLGAVVVGLVIFIPRLVLLW